MAGVTAITLDSEALFESLDRERRRRRMTRRALCAELGVSGASYCSWSYGNGISGDAIARIAQWLAVDIRDFVREEGHSNLKPEYSPGSRPVSGTPPRRST